MSLAYFVECGLVPTAAACLVMRECLRRFQIRYEYRWETFAVRGPGGRQLLHIRQTEIESIRPLTREDRMLGLGRFKRLARTSLAPKVVIRSTIAHAKPVIVSWEGRAIAGLAPQGYKLRPEQAGRKG